MARASHVTTALLTLVISAVSLVSAGVPASAADDDAAVTWSVRPADEDGPDGRSWIELTLDPGAQVTERLALRNLSRSSVRFAINAADGYLTANGRFNMLPSDQPSVGAGTWVEGPETVEVAAGATEIVAFTITVPENATPGDHPAGIAAAVESVGSSEDGNAVTIESRVGFPIMTRVTGELRPSLAVESVDVGYDISWNPLQPGRVALVYELVNEGNVRIQAAPVVRSQGETVAAYADARPLELLPGERRRVTVDVPGVWPLLYVPVEVWVDPKMVTPDGEPRAIASTVGEFGVWAAPLPQLMVLIGVVLVILALWAGRRRSTRRMRALLEEAREAGRRETPQ